VTKYLGKIEEHLLRLKRAKAEALYISIIFYMEIKKHRRAAMILGSIED